MLIIAFVAETSYQLVSRLEEISSSSVVGGGQSKGTLTAELKVMDKIAKDVGDVQSRLLDHRPVINAEIRYFVREFEEKRGYRESRLLENISKSVLEANQQMPPANSGDMNQQLSEVIKRLAAAHHMAERVQQRELEAQQGTQLKANMEQLKEDWAEFLKEQQRLKEEVDEEHARAVGQLSTKYSEKKKELAKFTL
ncbi:biogenesis of lysosome-related organelles complex 1 subunit 5 isoform X2 [Archocentrus centrarchus]|uniref:biogenesis of lysosome-related organelles complex 1 subunit 5 isoform X2 n=1 Tax=Archocentrus centrarchus TaxID=63155 RepID=UPI0011E9F60F|nr:biogenesis of lysosome-related organelles complex 1 subunit 5 isoform X2 [Archocentrus centrarchus]